MSRADPIDAPLSPRTARIRQLFWCGCAPAEIAVHLGLSDEAVEAALFARTGGVEVARPVFLLIEARDDSGEAVVTAQPLRAPGAAR